MATGAPLLARSAVSDDRGVGVKVEGGGGEHECRGEAIERGQLVDLDCLRSDQSAQPVLRVPSGLALCGDGPDDDGHLEDPWTGEVVPDEDFLVAVRPSR